ncbi:MAG: hypothetical protein K2J20_07010 [Bacilli bacterium]|nr:hypothetical protein [Bacilli bacterium]
MELKIILEKLFQVLAIATDYDLVDRAGSIVLENVKPRSFTIGPIRVAPEIHSILQDKYPEVAEKIGIGYDKLVRLAFMNGNVFIVDIKRYNDSIMIKLETSNNGIIEKMFLVKRNNLLRVETVNLDGDLGACRDYQCDINYYDSDNRRIEIDVETEKDVSFSREFMIPLFMARYLRTNFKKLVSYINILSGKQMMEMDEERLSDEDLLLFSSPFRLEDLESFAERESNLDTREILIENGLENEKGYIKFVKPEIIEKIKMNLLAQIGEGEVVISNNILQNLICVAGGYMLEGISTKGFLIKKMDGKFMLYFMHIENDEVVVVPQSMSNDEIREIYAKNAKNANVNGFKEFLEIERGLI